MIALFGNYNNNNNKKKISNMAKSNKSVMERKGKGNTGGIWLLMSMTMMLLLVLLQMQSCECRYLPTRSHGDDLDKLRELMLQILETSNEDNYLQQPRINNDGQRAAWINKLEGSYGSETMEPSSRKNHRRIMYENERY